MGTTMKQWGLQYNFNLWRRYAERGLRQLQLELAHGTGQFFLNLVDFVFVEDRLT